MTFNATTLRLYQLKEAGFVEWTSPRPITSPIRKIFVTDDIATSLKAVDPYFPRAEAAIVMGRFCTGFISVSRKKEPEADLKQMLGVDRMWCLAFRKPKSGGQGRLLGRFAAKDLFVGLGIHLRDDLGGIAYTEAGEAAISLWDQRLKFAASSFDALTDYLSDPYRDLDEDD